MQHQVPVVQSAAGFGDEARRADLFQPGGQVGRHIWGWGMNWSGQVGNGTVTPVGTPGALHRCRSALAGWGTVNNPAQVSCGYTYGVALLTNGTVWTWGTGPWGELGNGTTGHSYTPGQVTGLSNVTAISSGWKHILA